MSCVQCHDPHGGDILKPKGGLAMARQNESCAQCHREQTRPFVFEHEALREGCAVCHNPHGSINEKMLVESDPNLCLRCHAQVQAPGGEHFHRQHGSYSVPANWHLLDGRVPYGHPRLQRGSPVEVLNLKREML